MTLPLRNVVYGILISLIMLPWASATETATAYPVAGLNPDQRPFNAPVITEDGPLDRKMALHGIATPVPENLDFLDSQGAWFNPFIHPGMTGLYDIRGWHSTAATKKKTK